MACSEVHSRRGYTRAPAATSGGVPNNRTSEISWESGFAWAFDAFRDKFAQAKAKRDVPRPSEYWLRYGVGTRVNSDRADTIQRRHEFFALKMHEVLLPQMKDPTRTYGMLEQELIYYRDNKRCAVCNADVIWPKAEIHHVEQHRHGGRTILTNGALVHRQCHPKGQTAETAFAKKWGERLASMPSDERADTPANEEQAKQIEALAKLLVKAKPGTDD